MREKDQAKVQGHVMAFYDVPLLFEKNMDNDFDHTLLISCSLQTQIDRLFLRNQFSKEQALQRIHSQLPMSEKVKRADYVIVNEGSLEQLKSCLLQVVKELKDVAQS